ncbi:MAG: nitroreductase family protein [Patescibacteria group bacterium]
MDPVIKQIIDAAIWAPSGDNSQPWRFQIIGDKLQIFNIPNRDNPILNFQQSGSYIAHGALIENLDLLTKARGYDSTIILFPDKTNPDLIAEITLARNESDQASDNLEQYINKRHTNRKPYQTGPLDNIAVEALKRVMGQEYGQLVVVTEREKINQLAPLLSQVERIALENKDLHRSFFRSIFWDKVKNQRGEPGLFIKTLELPPPARLLFKLLKFWSATCFANFFGFSRLASKGNAKLYAQSGAYIAIIPKQDDPVGFVNAGRLMQRTWLTATSLGLSVQPVTGILFMARRFLSGDTGNFTQKHIDLALSAYRKITLTIDVSNKNPIAMLLRVGYGKVATARSARMGPTVQLGEF